MARKSKVQKRQARHARVRKHISGTPERPRLCVFRSTKHIYAQVIDDTTGNTLAAASTLDQDIKAQAQYGGNKAAARLVGGSVAKKAQERVSQKLPLTGAVSSSTGE
jgi:large subunit ribosomal protein L18